jgi:hypothetical protein
MAVTAHLKELETKHASLETEIKRELKYPQPDPLKISSLKKRKLYLKDQIQSFQKK